MSSLVDFIVHIDTHLLDLVAQYHQWVYAFLFAIVFAETGLVVTPFLPGDSLLFAAGTLAGAGYLDPYVTVTVLFVAAVAGDAVNYAVGRRVGPQLFRATDGNTLLHRLLNREHLNRAHAFFERYGGKAVVLGRFVPIVRTFVPFVAGAGAMSYRTFAFYNITGAIAWVGLCFGAGRIFGGFPAVKEHFTLITLGIVFVSVLPIGIELLRNRHKTANG